MPQAATTHAKRAMVELRQRIMKGALAGGTRLYEVPLAEEMEISRTPIREALSRLAEEGLLERGKGGGFMVRSFSYRDVVDAIELRGVLEGTAARLAAERGVDAPAMAQLRGVVAALDLCVGPEPEAVDFDRYSDLNGRFHDQLAALCGSDVLMRELARAKSLPFASPNAFMPDRAAITAFRLSLFVAQGQHRAMVDAILGREGARAEAIAREHARIARTNLEHLLKARSDASGRPASLALLVE